jgi:thioredoxin-related protein
MHVMQRALLVAIALLTPVAAQESSWLTNFEEAKAAAKKDGKVILADFTGSDWCGWCVKLKEEVFDTPEFKEWAAKKVVLLELDFPKKTPLPDELKAQNDKLKQQYGVKGFPTILFLDANGVQVGQHGYQPVVPRRGSRLRSR